jgi:hypothetical protein
LKTFPQPPNRTNLTALYGPIVDLLSAAKNQNILLEVQNSDGQESNERNNSGEKAHSVNFKFVERSEIEKGETRRSTAATTLVRKLRWSTLGLQFDWSKVCTLLFHSIDFSCALRQYSNLLILRTQKYSFYFFVKFASVIRNMPNSVYLFYYSGVIISLEHITKLVLKRPWFNYDCSCELSLSLTIFQCNKKKSQCAYVINYLGSCLEL